jgi:predicted metal-dependent hydrolase
VNRTTHDDAREKFAQRIRDWAARLDVRVQAVTIRKMRRKWASCSTAGRLTFDDSLLSKSRELQDYVIVHELLHLSVPNHGKLWKSLMRAYLGEYERYEEELRVLPVNRGRPRRASKPLS